MPAAQPSSRLAAAPLPHRAPPPRQKGAPVPPLAPTHHQFQAPSTKLDIDRKFHHSRRMSTSDAIVDSSLHGTDAGLEGLEIVTEEPGADVSVTESANHQPQGKPRRKEDSSFKSPAIKLQKIEQR
ncbi:hypothetical protein EJB05_28054, partial [Eragrostis curvula]